MYIIEVWSQNEHVMSKKYTNWSNVLYALRFDEDVQIGAIKIYPEDPDTHKFLKIIEL